MSEPEDGYNSRIATAVLFGDKPDPTAFTDIGRFFYEFSILEITMKLLLSKVAGIKPEAHDIITGALDFLSTAKGLGQLENAGLIGAEDGKPIKDIVSNAEKLNKIRNKIAHGTWTVHPDGSISARLVNRNNLEVGFHFSENGEVGKLADEVATLQRRVLKSLLKQSS